MHRSEFRYDLPPELIAQRPLPQRTASRLLVLDGAGAPPRDQMFADLQMLLRPGDLLISHPAHWALVARHAGRLPAGVNGITSTAPCPDDVAQALPWAETERARHFVEAGIERPRALPYRDRRIGQLVERDGGDRREHG